MRDVSDAKKIGAIKYTLKIGHSDDGSDIGREGKLVLQRAPSVLQAFVLERCSLFPMNSFPTKNLTGSFESFHI